MNATSSAFICPRCGKPALSIHRKTYDENTIIFCTECKLNANFTPSKEAAYDPQLTYKEFSAEYRKNNAAENLLTS